MRWGSLIGWGIVIYAVLLLSWNILAINGFAATVYAHIVQIVVLVLVCIIAGRSLKFRSWTDILPYSVCWAIAMALIDMINTVPVAGWGIYDNPNLWVGYALVVIIPLLSPMTRHHKAEPAEIT